MLHAIIYCRVSTEEQAQDGHHSLSAQETLCRNLAKDLGYEIAAVFKDPGKTATNMNRPGLQDALARCQSDRSIRAMLIQDTDRLARNTKDHLTIRALLQKCDVKLISVSQPMLEDSAEGNMIDTIIASVNQFQSDITKRKTLKGLEEKVRKGGWPRRAPLGYRNVGVGADGNTRIVEVDPQSGPLIQELFRLYATGTYSLSRLADYLYSAGLRSVNGNRVKENKIHEILRSEFYIGIINWNKITATGSHTPLIDEPTFRAASMVLHSHGGGFSRKRKHDFLLRGFLVCRKCGRYLVGEKHISRQASYYRCHTKGCEPPVRTDQIESAVQEEFRKIAVPENVLEEALNELRQSVEQDSVALEGKKAILLNQRTALKQKRDKLESKWMAGVVEDDDFQRLNTGLKNDIQAAEIGLAQLDSKKALEVESIAEVIAFTRLLDISYAKAAHPIKRLLLQFAFKHFEVQDRCIQQAVPSKLIGALAGARKIAQIAHEPVLSERAPELFGDCHPNGPESERACVRIRGSWGRNQIGNRTQNSQKVSSDGYFDTVPVLAQLLEDPTYLHRIQAIHQEIKSNLPS